MQKILAFFWAVPNSGFDPIKKHIYFYFFCAQTWGGRGHLGRPLFLRLEFNSMELLFADYVTESSAPSIIFFFFQSGSDLTVSRFCGTAYLFRFALFHEPFFTSGTARYTIHLFPSFRIIFITGKKWVFGFLHFRIILQPR